jgi:hypothetical protein
MKFHQLILTSIMAATRAFAGCGKKSSVDTSKLETSFKSAQPAQQSSVDKAVAAVKSADYSSAMTELQKMAKDAKLTPDQQQAIKDVLAQIQQAIADTASKAAGDASKAVGNLQKSLPK